MRNVIFANNEHYHIFNRGVGKKNIFLDNRDHVRFLFLILYFQFQKTFSNIGRHVNYFVKHQMFNISKKDLEEIRPERLVELKAFVIMPNHFHVLIEQKSDVGASKYMQKVLNAYAKYFNTKYKQNGHVFQGIFKAVHIASNEQLLHASAYIHRNPRELLKWRNHENKYFWSSYTDYTKNNRWPLLLEQQIILDQFKNANEYEIFLNTSSAKDLADY